MIQLKIKFHNVIKGSTDEWEQRVGRRSSNSDGQSPNSENYTDDPNGQLKMKTYEDLFCISQNKNPKEMVYDYDHETKVKSNRVI